MAEPQQPEKQGPSKWGRRIMNIVKTALRKSIGKPLKKTTAYEPQYELYEGQDLLEIQPVKRLKEKNLLNIMQSRSSAVATIEANWDFFNERREEVENIYANSMIYLDSTTSGWEYNLYKDGLKNRQFGMVDIVIRGKKYQYPVPPRVKVRYPIPGMKREWVVTIGPFGYNNVGVYGERYKELIDKICEDVKDEALKNAKTDEERKSINGRIEFINGIYKAVIPETLSKYKESIESSYYNFVKAASESSLKIEGYYDKFSQKRELFKSDNVKFYNTFKILQPVIYGTGAESAVVKAMLIDEKDNTDYEKIYGPNVKIHKWNTKENELGPGLDEYGYPLEVDEDGTVMIDKYPEAKGPKRKIPAAQLFIKDVDLLEMVNYLAVRHDTYRDDLRDGRFHAKTITIMDYVQANNKSTWNLWGTKDEDEIVGQSIFDIKLNNPMWGVDTAKIKVKSTDKNPAFNLEILKNGAQGIPPWKYVGRKHYYETPDESFAIANENPEQHITSRGVSMYIIEKITREMRKFDETIKVLNEIGQKGGFDYGTRPWDMWGKSMIQNIYDWRSILDRVNKPLEVKYTEKGYQEMYDLSKK